jgi:sporulation protein YlmC with PRC-barrel domain
MRGQLLLRQAIVTLIVMLLGTASLVDAKDKSGVLKASELIGMKVEGTDGKNLGKIRDLVIDPEYGDIEYAVLDFGGFLGIGDKYFAVPWDALKKTENGKKIALDTTKRDLKKAPGFDKNNWPDLSDQQQTVIIYEFYEVPLPADSKK